MPSQHLGRPVSVRIPGSLHEWLSDHATQHKRSLGSVIVQAIDEYRLRNQSEQAGGEMSSVSMEQVKNHLRTLFAHKFMRLNDTAYAPINFPGVKYNDDGTLSHDMKAKGTSYLMGLLLDSGFSVEMADGSDPGKALHKALWDKWTVEEVGHGRFIGQLFDDKGRIYRGCLANDAARYTVERLMLQQGVVRSFFVRGDGMRVDVVLPGL